MKLSRGQIAAILSAIATIATAFGVPEVAGIASNPLVSTIATALVGTLGGLIAGHLPGAKA